MINTFRTSGTTRVASGGPSKPKTFVLTPEQAATRVARQLITNGPEFAALKSLYRDFAPASHGTIKAQVDADARGVAFYGPLASYAETAAQFAANNIEGIMAGPKALLRFAREGIGGHCFAYIMASGHPMSAEESNIIRGALLADGGVFYYGYGNSEVGGKIAFGRASETAEKIPGCVGRVCDDLTVEIDDGQIRIKGPTVITDYVEGDAQAFRGGWFYPGDKAHFTEDGMLVLDGRA